MAEFDIAVIGGDKRTAYMIPLLKEKGYRIIGYRTAEIEENEEKADCDADSLKQAVESAEIIIGGIPFEKEGILKAQELSRFLRKRHMVFGGVIPEGFYEECRERDILCRDFMKDEEITVFNAIATAEGAVLEALRNKQTNLHQSKCLVLGYGRCGKVLCEKLKGLSARVTACARSSTKLAMAEAMGMDALNLKNLAEEIQDYEYIFNTIPAMVLEREQMEKIKPDSLIIDIASGKGGTDDNEAEKRGIKVLHCPGLPGKYAGKTSGSKLVEYVIGQLE